MPVNLVSEENLRSALRPYRVDPQSFEAGILSRIEQGGDERAVAFWGGVSPFLRAAAAFLPLSLLGCRGTLAAARLPPTTVSAKLIGYLTFPAISLFVLLGATVLSVLKIRDLRWQSDASPAEQTAQQEVVHQWWSNHKWGVGVVFILSLTLGMYGASGLLFLFYFFSFGILLYVITGFARLGIGNRFTVGSACLQSLIFLGQMAILPVVGAADIHFLDQSLVPAIFIGGVVVIFLLLLLSLAHAPPRIGNLRGTLPPMFEAGPIVSIMFVLLCVSLIAWMLFPTLWPATPSRIRDHVESFDQAPFGSVNWQAWEIPASWAVQSKLDPDFSRPRQLLAREIAGKQNPYILSNASRVGLLSADQIDQITAYETTRRMMVRTAPGLKPQMLTSLDQLGWVIRAAVLRDDLSAAERDILEQRLHATLQTLPDETFLTLVELLRATQLLDVIQRPVNPEQYRTKIHDVLREFHSLGSGGFKLAGGFRKYRKSAVERKNTWLQFLTGGDMPGDVEATSYAIELMAIYGVPEGLDLNWVRSFLRPKWSGNFERKWVAAVALNRLNRLPDAPQPSWVEYLYYERMLLAATILTGLCIFATLSSPIPKITVTASGAEPPPSSVQLD